MDAVEQMCVTTAVPQVATLTWDRSEGAVVYNVTAETSGGHVLSAGTAGTMAQFSDLQCGQTYFLSVQAVESVCRSVRSPAITLESGRRSQTPGVWSYKSTAWILDQPMLIKNMNLLFAP